jgi:hypothetical protein
MKQEKIVFDVREDAFSAGRETDRKIIFVFGQ